MPVIIGVAVCSKLNMTEHSKLKTKYSIIFRGGRVIQLTQE